jgi:hypothetical protein
MRVYEALNFLRFHSHSSFCLAVDFELTYLSFLILVIFFVLLNCDFSWINVFSGTIR